MRRAAKRDDNEALIVTALQSAGWTVLSVSDEGIMDLIAARHGVLSPMEVKGPNGKLTPKQQENFGKLAAAGVVIPVVRSPQEALNVVCAPRMKTIGTDGERSCWVAQNGGFICESCWHPENGLHAKDCPSRTALKPKPKVQNAYRAAKKMEEAMPKTHQEMLDAAGAVDLRDNMRLEHLGNGYSRTVPIDPSKRHGKPRGVEGELQSLKPNKCDCSKHPGRICGARKPGLVLDSAATRP